MTDSEKNELLGLFNQFFYGTASYEFGEMTGESDERCQRLCELMDKYNKYANEAFFKNLKKNTDVF